MSTQVFQVEGMTCGHCVHAVTSELTAVAADATVEVALGDPSTVTVTSDRPLTAQEITDALDEAGGYTLRAGSLA